MNTINPTFVSLISTRTNITDILLQHRPKTGIEKRSDFTMNLQNTNNRAGLVGDSKQATLEAEKGRQRTANSLNRAKSMLNKHASPTRSSVYQDGREGLNTLHSVHKTTAIAYNRAKCLGENEQADRLSFENRVKEIMQMKNTGAVLNARVIETWINETLADAEHLDIPGIIVKPQNKAPLLRYQVDRLFLNNSGVPEADIDRIYRGLFVYSIGFYEMIHRCLSHAKNKYTILSSFWKVFAILLEYCC